MESLINLAEERSFSNAAKKMNLTQPSLTKHIKNMEDLINVRVVNRENRDISLTPEGRIMYDCAKKIFKMIDEAEEKVMRTGESESGDIQISASTIPANYILPRVLTDFKMKYKDINCYIRTGDSDETIQRVLDDEVEIGFIGKHPDNKKIYAKTLWKDRIILSVPPSHHWRDRKEVVLEEVFREPFVVRGRGSATRSTVEEYLANTKRCGLTECNVVCELGSSEAIKEAVIAGLGISLMSLHSVRRELESGILLEIPIKECVIERDIYVIYKRRFPLRKHHKLFIEFVEDYRMRENGEA
jgi:DNA-binding transcriptional LysR family regulator